MSEIKRKREVFCEARDRRDAKRVVPLFKAWLAQSPEHARANGMKESPFEALERGETLSHACMFKDDATNEQVSVGLFMELRIERQPWPKFDEDTDEEV